MVRRRRAGEHHAVTLVECLAGGFVTLSFMRWTEKHHLFVLEALSFTSALPFETGFERWR